MGERKRGFGFGLIAVLVAVNLLLGALTVQKAMAGGGGGSCTEPESCFCFGNVCQGGFPGFDHCKSGFTEPPGGGKDILDQIFEQDISGEWVPTGKSCGGAN